MSSRRCGSSTSAAIRSWRSGSKDRKGRTRCYDDVSHYGKIVVPLKETIRLMGEIDELIASWPIE